MSERKLGMRPPSAGSRSLCAPYTQSLQRALPMCTSVWSELELIVTQGGVRAGSCFWTEPPTAVSSHRQCRWWLVVRLTCMCPVMSAEFVQVFPTHGPSDVRTERRSAQERRSDFGRSEECLGMSRNVTTCSPLHYSLIVHRLRRSAWPLNRLSTPRLRAWLSNSCSSLPKRKPMAPVPECSMSIIAHPRPTGIRRAMQVRFRRHRSDPVR